MPKAPQWASTRRARAATTPSFAPSPDRPGPRRPPSSRERPRLQRGRRLHRPLREPRALVPSPRKGRDPNRQRILQRNHHQRLHSLGVAFTISVPFERFTDLKGLVEGRKRWRRMAVGLDYFETRWKPKSWNTRHRFIFIRKRVRCQNKLPIQLDLFQPTEYGYEFKVIVTNQRMSPRKVVAFHEGRGSQAGHRKPGKRASTCSRNTERHRLTCAGGCLCNNRVYYQLWWRVCGQGIGFGIIHVSISGRAEAQGGVRGSELHPRR